MKSDTTKEIIDLAFWSAAHYARSRDGLAWEPEMVLWDLYRKYGIEPEIPVKCYPEGMADGVTY